ncbi:LuxR C-terminal-related transcriptional regulator [Subsaxibacter sp. CAU 1640]|uniref:helix-turn-helix and ligand-binding sensor domain-containing protein n=1 Tax=Subsaxibacter sp. CAU 1640 TaxID=2933271 RepID=UPI002004EF80|nr:LuxR C-terminal-related transcriptional regulator [Subsaxibacter sp. CAU 1640]MCK7590690.1 LuxR C-terminal-related transcriptional regulator [Subsaxibacter sp. CAU 1640]
MYSKSVPYFIYVLLFSFLMFNQLNAQYSPYFQNYSLSEYNAGNQNWGIAKGNDGKIYVANNNGLLVFDGLKWSLHEIPNKTTIRSVLPLKDRIYIGSYEEFGYWQKNSKGTLVYKSLSHLIDKKEFFNEEFWQIIPYKDAVVFRSFLNVYIYKNNKISQIKPSSTVLSIDVVDDDLFISTLKGGIFILENETPKRFIFNEIMIDAKVVAISDYDGSLMISTSLRGCFIYEDGKFKPWNSEINSIIKEQQLNAFSSLQNGTMVFGTIKNGIYITDTSGNVLFHISKENGLMNNTVLDQFVDNTDELWLGLDNGIASINLDSPHSFYNDVTGKLGAVYDVILFEGTIYIGSNTGLYYIDRDNILRFIEGSQGQVWELKEIEGQLLCGHNNGTYLVQNKEIKLLSAQTGGWVLKKVPEQSNLYMQGAYTGIVKFDYRNGDWEVKHLGGPRMPVRFLVFEDSNTAWAAHAYKGLFKIKFNNSHDSITEIKDYGKKDLTSDYNIRTFKLKSNTIFKTNDGWKKYEPLLDSIVPFKYLNENFSKDSYIISEEENEVLAMKNKEVIELKSLSDPSYHLTLSDRYFKKRLIVGYERVSLIKDSIYALNLNDGFMMINSQRYSEKDNLFKPIIESLELDKKFMDLNGTSSIEVPFKNKNISISISSPNSRNHFFEYSIANLDSSHWYPLEREKLELSNLNSGDYKLLFRTTSSSGISSPTTSFQLTVLPPWYKTIKGFFLFLFLAAISVVIFYTLHKRKIKKEQELLTQQFELEQRELLKEKTKENDRKIVELKNEALKNEIKLKSKQLANTAMALVKKNEALLELKNELIQHKGNFDNPFSYKKILKKVDGSIGQKDEWEVFEYNFNQVHEEFFNGLKKKFPQLTHKDLKICAYIKMNLTTKEIAPLLNISPRGVETQRYRLKRKLDLESDKNLTDYLVNFK